MSTTITYWGQIKKLLSIEMPCRKLTKNHPNIELWRFSMSCSRCLALFFCLFISSQSRSSVGSSRRQTGHELVRSNQGTMQSCKINNQKVLTRFQPQLISEPDMNCPLTVSDPWWASWADKAPFTGPQPRLVGYFQGLQRNEDTFMGATDSNLDCVFCTKNTLFYRMILDCKKLT